MLRFWLFPIIDVVILRYILLYQYFICLLEKVDFYDALWKTTLQVKKKEKKSLALLIDLKNNPK
jgi:hypothetical protein